MDRRTKTKLITTLVCMALSLAALLIFLRLPGLTPGRRALLVLLALSWLASGMINLYGYLKK